MNGVARIGLAAAALAAVLGTGAVLMWPPAQAAGLLRHGDQAVVAEGAYLYAEHCAACHGAALEGEADWTERDADGYLPAPPHDQTGHTWHHPDAQLFAITKYGTEAIVGQGYRSRMPGFAEVLDDDQILAVLSYIKSTWPARVIEVHDRINSESGG